MVQNKRGKVGEREDEMEEVQGNGRELDGEALRERWEESRGDEG